MISSSPSLADQNSVSTAVDPAIVPPVPSSSLLPILPFHYLNGGAGTVGAATNPGLVSPTDSQSGLRKDILLSVASHSVPTLQHHYSTASALPTTFPNEGCSKEPAPIIPRPLGTVILPKIPSYPAEAAAITFDLSGPVRLNKFVRRLHDMLVMEKESGIVEWRRGLLVLFSTDAFTRKILPKYFNTRNFKTFRRQLNYYGFVHVRSFSATGSSTTALWINQNLAQDEANDDVSAVLKLRRVEPNETAKTVEGRRQRKELALHTVEEDIGLDAKKLQLDQIRSMAIRGEECSKVVELVLPAPASSNCEILGIDIPRVIHVPPTESDEDCIGRSTPSPLSNPVEINTAAANMLLMLARS